MADITWSAYALAMFTPEQRAAAANAVPEPPEVYVLPPVGPVNLGTAVIPSGDPGSGTRVTIDGQSYDANNPLHLRIIYDAGWYYYQGKWVPPVAGVARTIDQAVAAGFGKPSSLAVVPSSSFSQGMTVLGNLVPIAAAVVLPEWVNGRVGVIRMGEGMRPESGGEERFIWGERMLPLIVWD